MIPIYIGVYYGLQEGVSYQRMMEEMEKLNEEILDIKREGEIMLCMDANAKIGLLGENVSRNGKMLLNLFDDNEILIINKTDKCKGVVTRQNRKKDVEKSAIDFVTVTYGAYDMISGMEIDELGDFRFKSQKETDHNTIFIDLILRASS